MAATKKRMHPFFAPRPKWRFPKTDGPPRYRFLDLPAEVRIVIYEQAMHVPVVINKIGNTRRNGNGRHPHWEIMALIADCFNLMQTCRIVYQEAAPIFWTTNLFKVYSVPTHGLWPRPDVREDHKIDGLSTIGSDWVDRCAVESAVSQKMIRKIAWCIPRDPWFRRHGQWMEKANKLLLKDAKHPAITNLSNVQEFYIYLSGSLSRKVHYPTIHEVHQLVEEGVFDAKLLERLESTSDYCRIVDAETLRGATIAAIIHFAFEMLPNIRKICFAGVLDLSRDGHTWYGKDLTAFPPDCLYLRGIKDYFEGSGKVIEWHGMYQVPGTCAYCLTEWTEEHRSVTDDLKICPGLSNEGADDILAAGC